MAEISSKIDKSSKIAVLCGGMSSEAEVSKRSGKGCYEALKRLGYKNAELVEVDENIASNLATSDYRLPTILNMSQYTAWPASGTAACRPDR